MPTVAEILITSAARLANAGLTEPRREAASILSFVTGRDRTFLIAHPEYSPTAEELASFDSLVARRETREPLQYITGRREFYGLNFMVAPGVLIPRPETELIVDAALEFLIPLKNPRFCEVGIGSGCISTAILANAPNARAVAIDISAEASAIARMNARANGVDGRLDLVISDVFEALFETHEFDAVVSNPPYVAASDIDGLQPEVRDFEPIGALTDGLDGLSIIRRVIAGAPPLLRPGGLLLVEIGLGQATGVMSMIDRSVWSEATFLKDLQGIDRTLHAILK